MKIDRPIVKHEHNQRLAVCLHCFQEFSLDFARQPVEIRDFTGKS